jgi:hypothetical protein
MSDLAKETTIRTLVVEVRVPREVLSYFDSTVDAPSTSPTTPPTDSSPTQQRSSTPSEIHPQSGGQSEAIWRSSLPDFNCESLQQIHESLGFIPSATHEKHRSSNPAVAALYKDISAFARRLHEGPSRQQLALAAHTGEFNDELDALLDAHGTKIWGRNLDD